MSRATEDGAGAVFHEHEVGDIDRQLPALDEGMPCVHTGLVAPLLRGLDGRLAGAHAVARDDEIGQRRVRFGEFAGERMVG